MPCSVMLAPAEPWNVRATTTTIDLDFAVSRLLIAVIVVDDTDGTRDLMAIFSSLQYREAEEYARSFAERRKIHGYHYVATDYARDLAARRDDADRFWAAHDDHHRTSN